MKHLLPIFWIAIVAINILTNHQRMAQDANAIYWLGFWYTMGVFWTLLALGNMRSWWREREARKREQEVDRERRMLEALLGGPIHPSPPPGSLNEILNNIRQVMDTDHNDAIVLDKEPEPIPQPVATPDPSPLDYANRKMDL